MNWIMCVCEVVCKCCDSFPMQLIFSGIIYISCVQNWEGCTRAGLLSASLKRVIFRFLFWHCLQMRSHSFFVGNKNWTIKINNISLCLFCSVISIRWELETPSGETLVSTFPLPAPVAVRGGCCWAHENSAWWWPYRDRWTIWPALLVCCYQALR